MGLFAPSAYDDAALFLALCEIARCAAGSACDPSEVTQPHYDEARAPAGHPHAPTASQTARRFGVRWRLLLPRALNANYINRFLGANRADADADLLEDEDIIRALRTIASYLGKPTVTPWSYDQAVHLLLRRQRPASRHRTPVWMPSSVQIVSYCQTWAAALKLARLEPTRGPGMRNGLPVLDALDLCITAHGALPSHRELTTFATANNFAMSRRTQPWASYVEQVKARRAERGDETPEPLPVRHPRRPDYMRVFEHIAGDPDLPHKVKKDWSEAECIQGLIRFLIELPPGRGPNYNAYKGYCADRPDVPWPRSFERYGGFTVLRATAQRELRRRRRPS